VLRYGGPVHFGDVARRLVDGGPKLSVPAAIVGPPDRGSRHLFGEETDKVRDAVARRATYPRNLI
jgi:hypothetical protein